METLVGIVFIIFLVSKLFSKASQNRERQGEIQKALEQNQLEEIWFDDKKTGDRYHF